MAAFQALSKAPVVDVVDKVMPIVFLSDKSACITYDRTSTFRKVNDARRDLFTRKGRYNLATLRKIPRKCLKVKTLMFSMATRIFPVETNRAKAFRRDSIKHFDSAFWLGCAFRNCRLYCVFFRIAPPPCLRSSIEWYAYFAIYFAIYLFNLASASLHCLRNIRIFISEIYIARDDITTIFHNLFYR